MRDLVTPHTVRTAALERIFFQLHRQTHLGSGKLAHPRCRLCQEEFEPERLEADGASRRRLGLL